MSTKDFFTACERVNDVNVESTNTVNIKLVGEFGLEVSFNFESVTQCDKTR